MSSRLSRIVIRLSRLNKWRLAVIFVVPQVLLVYAAVMVWAWQADSVSPESQLGRLSDFIDVATSADLHGLAWMTVGVLLVLQLMLVWPVRKPVGGRAGGWPLRLSIALAGAVSAALTVGFVLAVVGTLMVYDHLDTTHDWWPWFFGIIFAASWIVWTPVIWSFATRTPAKRESALRRVASRLLLGTIVETAAVIPLDVMVRRKESCYCATGTFWALSVCGAAVLIVCGPFALYALLGRRRRRWYHGKCDACGYDMSAILSADRCPECGAGWRPSAGVARA